MGNVHMPSDTRIPSSTEWKRLKKDKITDDSDRVYSLIKALEGSLYFYEKIDILFLLLEECQNIENENKKDDITLTLINNLKLTKNTQQILMSLLDIKDPSILPLLKAEKTYFRQQDPVYIPIIKPTLATLPQLGVTHKKPVKQKIKGISSKLKSLSKLQDKYKSRNLDLLSKQDLIKLLSVEVKSGFSEKEYDALADSEKKRLKERIKMGWDAAHRVEYLDEKQREQFRVVIHDGKLYYIDTQNGFSLIPCDSIGSLEETIFVMNAQGDLFIHPAAVTGIIHHSSLLAGSPVMFAGQIQIKDGKILQIDNLSGHYLPGERNILLGMNYLKTKNALDDAQIKLSLKENDFKGRDYNVKNFKVRENIRNDFLSVIKHLKFALGKQKSEEKTNHINAAIKQCLESSYFAKPITPNTINGLFDLLKNEEVTWGRNIKRYDSKNVNEIKKAFEQNLSTLIFIKKCLNNELLDNLKAIHNKYKTSSPTVFFSLFEQPANPKIRMIKEFLTLAESANSFNDLDIMTGLAYTLRNGLKAEGKSKDPKKQALQALNEELENLVNTIIDNFPPIDENKAIDAYQKSHEEPDKKSLVSDKTAPSSKPKK